MKRLIGLCIAGCLTAASLVSAAGEPVGKKIQGLKLEGSLKRVVTNAKPTTKIPVIIRMKAQISAEEIVDAVDGLSRKEARQTVIGILKPLAEASQADLLDQLNGLANTDQVEDVTPLWIANLVCAKMTPAAIQAVASRADIEYVNYDPPLSFDQIFPTRPGEGGVLAEIECGVNLMNAPKCWAEGIDGDGVVCCIIDTGCCLTHNDIKNQIWKNPGEIPGNGIDDDGNGFKDDINGWNFESNNNNVGDGNGHGSHTAGTVAGDGTNGSQCGMAPDTQMMICKFFNSFSGQQSVWSSMQYGLANGADIITASLGWPHSQNPDRKTWRQISENCMNGGVATIYAAGNEGACCGVDSVRTPGDVPAMITVGATNCNDVIASFSSRGPVTWQNVPPYNDWPYPPGKIKPEICAPGENTKSHSLCNGYSFLSGTSMATPHVAGAVSLMLQANPNLSHYQVLDILKKTAKDLGVPGEENTHGSGRVDAYAAMKMAQSMACYADFNGDGTLDIDDFIAFQTAYGLGDPDADCDESGGLDVDDFVCYQTEYGIGCP